MWQCLRTPKNNSPVNTTAVCTSSNETIAQATLTLLGFFGWRRALVLTDSTTPQEINRVSHSGIGIHNRHSSVAVLNMLHLTPCIIYFHMQEFVNSSGWQAVMIKKEDGFSNEMILDNLRVKDNHNNCMNRIQY